MRFVLTAVWLGLVSACGTEESPADDPSLEASTNAPSASSPGAAGSSGAGSGGAAEGPDAPSVSNGGSPAQPNPTGGSGPSSTVPDMAEPEPTPEPSAGGSGGQGAAGAAGGSSHAGSGVGAGGSGASGGGVSDGGASGGGADDPGEPRVHFVGRFRDDGAEGFRFAWSGSGVIAEFEGDSVSVELEDGGSNQFTVVIDGELLPKLVASAGAQTYPLAEGLGAGPHRVELYRRTEASFGPTAFLGFDFAGGTLLAPSVAERRLEIIGDSISCGYGNEGESATCGFSADTENHYATYGAIAARQLDAEVVTIAWSGKGIVYNYDTDTNEPLPELYDRIVPSEGANDWDFAVEPHAIVINLGTNDFSTDGDPEPALFAERYLAFLEHLRDVYPDALILCTVAPLLGGSDLDAARAGIETAVAARNAADDALVTAWNLDVPNDDPGCDYHPGLATHQAMADALVDELSMRLGW